MTTLEAVQKMQEAFPFKGYKLNNDKYIDVANTIRKHLEPGGKILDFGCGPMDVDGILQVLGYQCTGFDDLSDAWHKIPENRKKIFDYIEDMGMNITVSEGEWVEWKGFPYEKESFDMFMNHDILEHLHNSPKDLLNDGMEMVKPGGLLYLTVPNAVNIKKRLKVIRGKTNHPPFNEYYWYPGNWRGHVREYCRNDLELLAKHLGLEVISIKTCHHMTFMIPSYAKVPYKIATSIFPDWADTWQLVARKPKNWKNRKELSDAEMKEVMKGTFTKLE